MLEESGAQRWPDLPDNRPRSTSDGERGSWVPPNAPGPGEPVASPKPPQQLRCLSRAAVLDYNSPSA
jgi:hypothetical protein